MTNPPTVTANYFPFISFQDAPAAIDWLCRAFTVGDPEGNLWSIGNYLPHASAAARARAGNIIGGRP
ncbi:MAG TPA: hypothetical protein VKV26_08115 [Dehalococcoidia bacterium]|nr:hypothetical protein [Dehalococcoidia bacterium]